MIGDVEKLTRRQRECLRLVPELVTSKRIADRMGLEPASVDKTLYRAMRTLGVTTRAEAAALLMASEAARSINLDSPPSRPPVSIPRPVANEDADDAYLVRPEAKRGTVEEERLAYRPHAPTVFEIARGFLVEPGERYDLTPFQKLRIIAAWIVVGVLVFALLGAVMYASANSVHSAFPDHQI